MPASLMRVWLISRSTVLKQTKSTKRGDALPRFDSLIERSLYLLPSMGL